LSCIGVFLRATVANNRIFPLILLWQSPDYRFSGVWVVTGIFFTLKTIFMAHSKSDVWVHFVFCTKYRAEMINGEVEAALYAEITHQFMKLNCIVHKINGVGDHVHVLAWIDLRYSISEVVCRVKGGSSYAIRRRPELNSVFSWSVGYYAASVSKSDLESVSRYIDKQKEHHRGNHWPGV
jgi:putative transposase